MAQMRSELELTLDSALSRPQEWFTILSRNLDHGETELRERAARMAAAKGDANRDMEVAAGRAEEELESQVSLHALKQKQVAAEVHALRQQIVRARSELR